MAKDNEILMKFGQEVVKRLRANYLKYDRVATGDTSKSTQSKVDGNSLIVDAREHTSTLEYGRKPTGLDVKPSFDFVAKIQRWINARGLNYNAYAVARKIHQSGFEGTPGVLTDVINDSLFEELYEKLQEDYVINITKKL